MVGRWNGKGEGEEWLMRRRGEERNDEDRWEVGKERR